MKTYKERLTEWVEPEDTRLKQDISTLLKENKELSTKLEQRNQLTENLGQLIFWSVATGMLLTGLAYFK